MRRLVRRLAWSLAELACFTALAAGGCVLFTRHALNQGALAIQPWGCITARDDPALIDRTLTLQIQLWSERRPATAALPRHTSGLIALLGLRLGFSQSDRHALVVGMLATTPICLSRPQYI
ncbi:hypothetical protein [Novosphingobium rosa]|uniref:hypothetical protein n=1 Tax=Novosphingobium rosa TaxID=76978 RepID=UPI0008306982|nr:hypothetical protein [Novosphingobium rosa]